MRYRKNLAVTAGLTLLAVVAGAVVSPGEDNPCAKCHPAEAAGYASTQMAHSFSPAAAEPPGVFVHSASNTRFSVTEDAGRMLQRLQRGNLTGAYYPAYAIGSGTHAVAYIIELSGHLFQSPICFYAKRGWEMAPGYEHNPAPDFLRPITADCLFCHVGRERPVAHTLNRFEDPPIAAGAITCERCHGPVEAHLRQPVPGSIINPANLAPRPRDSVCEQCHLSGEARIPNAGKQISDFHPGEELESIYSVYVFADSLDPTRPAALKVISQAQQLALSTCARMSNGRLWCGTCHDPHRQPENPRAWFRSRCLSCHGAALLERHPKPNDDCIGCHMPQRPVSDGGHTVFTDHRIARRPPAEEASPQKGESGTLVAWHQPGGALAERNLGLADIEVGERTKDFPLVSQGSKLLMESWGSFPNDPPVLTSLGQVLLGLHHDQEAEAVFERAIQVQPDDPANYIHAGLAWKDAKQYQRAIENLEKALKLDPILERPYLELAEIYSAENLPEMVRLTYKRFLKAFPQSLEAQKGVRDQALH
jgi:tetratricopeptide (TPR) repeat protein